MRQGFLDIPIELEEAALVDGANHARVFWHISMRLALPCLMASMLISIAYTWNEFLFALTISSRESSRFLSTWQVRRVPEAFNSGLSE